MNPVQKKLATAVLSGGSIAALFAGSTLIRSNNIARAAEEAPPQGKVQAPVQVTPEERQQLEGLAGIFKKVGHAVEPAVVNINVIKSGKAALPPGFEERLKKLFPDRDGDGEPDIPEGFKDEGGEFQQMGTGSGVVMEVNGSDAYILTNNHVAGGASEMIITLADGRRIENGKLLGTDVKSDLAVVQVKADGLVAAPWGDSDKLEKGDWIMAFGSPFGYVGSMTHGIVSALNRRAGILGDNGYENFIQVDAPINPGNSGGPLVNTHGEVVGINTAIASRSGGFQGIGFAIPSNQAKWVYTALKTNGKVVRGWLGVKIGDVAERPELAATFNFNKRDGVVVEQTYAGTPALGKLEHGDIVTRIGDNPVKNTQQLRNAIAATPPGADLKMQIFRDGKQHDVTVKIGEQPEDMRVASASHHGGGPARNASDTSASILGMKLATPNDKLAQEYALGETLQGALVTELDPKGVAAKSGLMRGDVITEVFKADVQTAKQAAEAIEKADKTKPIRLYVTSPSPEIGARFVVIKPHGS